VEEIRERLGSAQSPRSPKLVVKDCRNVQSRHLTPMLSGPMVCGGDWNLKGSSSPPDHSATPSASLVKAVILNLQPALYLTEKN
jgi:hypothetical protein